MIKSSGSLLCVFRRLAPLLLLVALPMPLRAQTTTNDANTIVRVGTGWDCDCFLVTVNRPVINPAGCPTPDGYMAEAASSGYKTHYAAALTAFSIGRPIYITASNSSCVHGRPRVIGVVILPL